MGKKANIIFGLSDVSVNVVKISTILIIIIMSSLAFIRYNIHIIIFIILCTIFFIVFSLFIRKLKEEGVFYLEEDSYENEEDDNDEDNKSQVEHNNSDVNERNIS